MFIKFFQHHELSYSKYSKLSSNDKIKSKYPTVSYDGDSITFTIMNNSKSISINDMVELNTNYISVYEFNGDITFNLIPHLSYKKVASIAINHMELLNKNPARIEDIKNINIVLFSNFNPINLIGDLNVSPIIN